MYNFETNITQHVVVNQAVSNTSQERSPASRGTVRASLLFLILIFDIEANTNHGFIQFFAYTKMSMEMQTVEGTEKPQRHMLSRLVGPLLVIYF